MLLLDHMVSALHSSASLYLPESVFVVTAVVLLIKPYELPKRDHLGFTLSWFLLLDF